MVSPQARYEKSAGHVVMTGTKEHSHHACAQAWNPAYFSTPVTTTPCMNTRWLAKKSRIGNSEAISAAA